MVQWFSSISSCHRVDFTDSQIKYKSAGLESTNPVTSYHLILLKDIFQGSLNDPLRDIINSAHVHGGECGLGS